jgi:hypothetical protein
MVPPVESTQTSGRSFFARSWPTRRNADKTGREHSNSKAESIHNVPLCHFRALMSLLGHDSQYGRYRLHLGIGEASIDFPIEPLDNLGGCVLGTPTP